MSPARQILIIAGPTATGKSDIALKIAEAKDGIIINADSKQVYKEIPLITAQPQNRREIPHYLYGHISINSHYSVRVWLEEVIPLIKASAQNKVIIIVGGSGMYINALLTGFSYTNKEYSLRSNIEKQLQALGNKKFYDMLQKEGADIDTIHYNDSYRLVRRAEDYLAHKNKVNTIYDSIFKNALLYVLMPERKTVYHSIDQRFLKMLNMGVIDEIRSLDFTKQTPAFMACGIREILQYLHNEISLSTAVEEAQRSTRRYAKRQMTWFRNQFSNAIFVENPESLLL